MFRIRLVRSNFNDIDIWGLVCCMILYITPLLNGISAVDYSTLGAADGKLSNMGLTEIPTNIPCSLRYIFLRHNLLQRIEVDSFNCLNKARQLWMGQNLLTHISLGAFDPMRSLVKLGLANNKDLHKLPPHYGPNTANMVELFIEGIDLQITPPNSYFDQMPNLQALKTNIDFSNDSLGGLTNVRHLGYYGSSAPNFTDRTPNIETIAISKALAIKNVPDENVVGLSYLQRVRLNSCDTLPLFDGAVSLSVMNVESCQITSLPDYRHLVSLQKLNPDTSKFYCDTGSCWMLFETITNEVLASVVRNIKCHGPRKFEGFALMDISPVQMHCFEGLYVKVLSIEPIEYKYIFLYIYIAQL